MKRLALFLLLAGVGTAVLVHMAGGFEGPLRTRPQPIVEERTETVEPEPRIEMGKGSPDISALEGITQPAPPRALVWSDRLSGERIEIPTFVPWRFQARDARPLQTPDSQRQGVLCRDVDVRLFRDPRTRAEAMALLRSEPEAYDALLHQRFTAKEARVYGRLGEALASNGSSEGEQRTLGDTEIQLTKDVVLTDRSQGLQVSGNDMTIWPEQDRAEGDGRFTMRHEAMVLEGRGLRMERDEARGWSRVTIARDPVLRIVSEGRGKDGKPIFDFGPGEFRPATIASTGRAILVRQEGRTETAITITFSDKVNAVQHGGRTLSAGHAELVAVKPVPGARNVAEGGWSLQHFHATKGVKMSYPGRTRKGADYLTSITAERMIHDVPAAGPAATVLEGDVLILLRGELAVLGPQGRLRLMCRDRAWIGPLPAGAPNGGLDRTTLQQIGLRGQARIERETVGPARVQDVLEADAIDLVVLPQRDEPKKASALEPETRMLAIHFAALGNVLVGGTRIRGQTHRLVGDELHTEHPHVTAEGTGTRFEFLDLGPRQRLLGPAPEDEQPAAEAKEGDDPPARKGRWVLQRLLARGAVDIDTSVGGPALGIPAHLTGDEVSYDRISRRARLRAIGATPARIAWSASETQTNEVVTRELTFDRGGGRITATGGVRGELYVARNEGGPSFSLPRTRRAGRDLRGATLSVRTDARIDIHMLRGGTSWRPAPGKEQVIRIAGPVTTALRAPDNSIDRMRSQSLEVALVFNVPDENATPAAPTRPAARAAREPETRTPQRRVPLERLDVQARSVQIDMKAGDVHFLRATGDVDLKGRGGHVRGEGLTYRKAGRIEVEGTRRAPAVAFLGASDQRSEVRAQRLALHLIDGNPTRLEAHAPASGQSEVHLYRDVRAKPGQLEYFHVTYEGTVVITHGELRAGRVRVIRRLREPGARTWGEPAVLRSPTLRVFGRKLLSTDEGAREITRIVAEGTRSGRKNEVNFLSGKGAKRLQIWGHRFDFDVVKRTAQLTGLPHRDVTMQRGDDPHSVFTRVTVDMKTNLPTAEGSVIHWRPR